MSRAVLKSLLVLIGAAHAWGQEPGSELQRQAAADPRAVRLRVAEGGIYRISFEDLGRMGLAVEEPRDLCLLRGGSELAFAIEGDGICFVGRGTPLVAKDNPRRALHDPNDVVWALHAPGRGRLMERERVAASGRALRQVQATAWFEEDGTYIPMRTGEEVERWFWSVLRPQGEPFRFQAELPGLAPRSERVRVEFAVAGVDRSPEAKHGIEVAAGGRVLAHDEWQGPGMRLVAFEVPPAAVASGVEVRTAGGTVIALDRVRVDYPRRPEAVSGHFDLALEGPGRVRVSGLGGGTVVGVDVTDPDRPVWLEGLSTNPELGTSRSSGARFHLARSTSCLAPAAIETNAPSNLREAGIADYVVVAPRAFHEALAPLVALRERSGLTVLVARLQDVYDEYSAGLVDPAAIRAFISERRGKGARYALLVGDGTSDPKADAAGALLPVHWVEGEFLGHVASDAWFGDGGEEHGRPELAIGRFPVRTVEELETIVAKTIRYESATGDWRARALFVAGDEAQFREATDELAKLLPAGRKAIRVTFGQDSDAPGAIRRAWEEGVGLVHYFGHGTLTGWGRRGELLGAEALAGLGDGERAPVLFAMNCLNGAFANPKGRCFAEAALLEPEGGAVAFVGSTSLCLPEPQYRLHRLLYARALAADAPPLGLAVVESLRDFFDPAKAEGDEDVVRSWVLLGDPALRVR